MSTVSSRVLPIALSGDRMCHHSFLLFPHLRLAPDLGFGQPFTVFAVANPGGKLNEAMYTTNAPLVVSPGEPRFSSKGERRVAARR